MSLPTVDMYDDWRDWAQDLLAELEARQLQLVKPEDVGTLKIFMGTRVGLGYLPCDGTSFSQPSFPALALFLGGTTLPTYASPLVASVVGIKT